MKVSMKTALLNELDTIGFEVISFQEQSQGQASPGMPGSAIPQTQGVETIQLTIRTKPEA